MIQVHWWQIALVGLGGMAGSICRFGVSTWFVQYISTGWPWGTFIVNLIGCLIIGIMMGAKDTHSSFESWKLLVASGFCGGFTTFSAFSLEGFAMIRQEQYFLFGAYALSSIVLGLLCVAAGYFFIRII